MSNSGTSFSSEEVHDIRKRKRMISNRESARRSRQRKQQHLDNLTAQINQMKIQNNQILVSTSTTTQMYLNVEAENSILRAQLNELTNRLNSLNDIVRCLTTVAAAAGGGNSGSEDPEGFEVGFEDGLLMNNNNNWGFGFANFSVMPAMDAFMC